MISISEVLSTLLYTGIGIVLFILGYHGVALILKKKYNLNKDIDEHNVAAGVAVAGMFIAIAIVISGAIQ